MHQSESHSHYYCSKTPGRFVEIGKPDVRQSTRKCKQQSDDRECTVFYKNNIIL